MMREIILASHGALASGMADTARMIIGDDCPAVIPIA